MAKRHHSKRDAMNVANARVIRRGCGGGDPARAKVPIQYLDMNKAERKSAQHLDKDTKADDKSRMERIARITKRVHKGRGLKVVKRG